MAHEELMERLPEGFEKVAVPGIFLIRDNGGSWSVTAFLEPLVTCGGPNSKEDAIEFACALNRVWNRKLKEFGDRLLKKEVSKQ